MKTLFASFACIALACVSVVAGAQSYPDRVMRIVIAFPPGGGADLWARILGRKMTDALGQNVIVESRAGGGGSIGTRYAARATPDGYTLTLGVPTTHAIVPQTLTNLPYDPVKDFAPITLVASVAYVMMVNPDLPFRSLKDLIAFAKATPEQVRYASAGIGTETHLIGEMFRGMADLKILHVPYQGVGPEITAVMSGEAQLMFTPIAAVISHINSGKLRPISVITAKRVPLLPNVPTAAESALPHFIFDSWFAMFAPAGTPQAIIEKLNATLVKIVRSPDMRERFASLGAEPIGSTPQELRAFLQAELTKYGKLVESAGITLK